MIFETTDIRVRRTTQGQIVNALSIDVEDYFQVGAFEQTIARDAWSDMDLRVEANTHALLDLLAHKQVSATFFCLGWIAERAPSLIKRIVADGHELANHGYDHRRLIDLSPETFREDLRTSQAILEDIGGCDVRGYRAPSFSIGKHNLWALRVLSEEGYAYSSSIFPIKHDHYGMPDAPKQPFRFAGSQLVEIPMTTARFAGRTIGCSGGGYFRLLPYGVSKRLFSRVHHSEKRPVMFYMHPWEIDTHQPIQHDAPALSRFRHYVNLDTMFAKVSKLLDDFAWDRVDRVYLDGFLEADEANVA